jgi:hypothetical protein
VSRYALFRRRLAPIAFILAIALIGHEQCTKMHRTHATVVLDLGDVAPRVVSVDAEVRIGDESAAIFHRAAHPMAGAGSRRVTIVVIGPGTPVRDELDQPLHEPPPRRMGRIRDGSRDDLAGLAEDLAGIAGLTSDTWQVERPDDVRCAAFADATRVRCVFVTSDAATPTTAVLLAEGTALRDPFTSERIAITAGRASIAMPARGVRLLIVE